MYYLTHIGTFMMRFRHTGVFDSFPGRIYRHRPKLQVWDAGNILQTIPRDWKFLLDLFKLQNYLFLSPPPLSHVKCAPPWNIFQNPVAATNCIYCKAAYRNRLTLSPFSAMNIEHHLHCSFINYEQTPFTQTDIQRLCLACCDQALSDTTSNSVTLTPCLDPTAVHTIK